MTEIKTVAIAGASGNLGPHVLKALLEANFKVTVLTRSKKPDAYDANVKVIEVDFTSVESLTSALKGIDAVVSAVGSEAIEGQTILVDAAVAAGVKRFIPSEFGGVTTNPKVEFIPAYARMWKVERYLQEKAEAGKITWTVLACGPFLEFMFATPMVLDFKNHKATLFDEGDNKFSSNRFGSIGKAITGILNNFEATKNRAVKVSEAVLSQNRLLGFSKELKPEIKWEVAKKPASAVLKEGLDALAAGDFNKLTFIKMILGTQGAGDVYGAEYTENDNELLGINELTGRFEELCCWCSCLE